MMFLFIEVDSTFRTFRQWPFDSRQYKISGHQRWALVTIQTMGISLLVCTHGNLLFMFIIFTHLCNDLFVVNTVIVLHHIEALIGCHFIVWHFFLYYWPWFLNLPVVSITPSKSLMSAGSWLTLHLCEIYYLSSVNYDLHRGENRSQSLVETPTWQRTQEIDFL